MAASKEDITEAEGQHSLGSRPELRPHVGMAVAERVRLVRPLGSGGMADVWVADHLTLGNEVAVKFLRWAQDPVMRERFTREAQLAARIDHPHAVRIFDHGLTEDGTPFMVMELIDGETLGERIRRAGSLRLEDAGAIVGQIAQVLTYAHELGILHRDIKPHNVMLQSTDRLFVKVVDFGLAKTLSEPEDQSLTQAGWLVGTPAYMAPEQLVGGAPATVESDVWSLAVVTYEALTGQRPFRGPNQAAIALAMLVQQYPPATSLRPELPATIDAFFSRAFDPEPSARFQTARAMSEALQRALSETASAPLADGRIRFSDTLHGREAELAALDSALSKCAERSGLVLIAGYAGVGKTALVQAARRSFAERGALFVDGKFDQFNRGIPYDSLLQALRKLVRYVSSRSAPSIADWRTHLTDALGDVAGVLTDLIPELEEVLGPQPSLLETSPSESRHRFHHAVSRLLHGVGTAEHPLVLFFDDLQWADLPTIELMSSLVGGPDRRHVLVVATYRSNEVDAHHPLHDTIEQATEAGALETITLGPLGEDAVLDMLTEVLGPVPGRVRLSVVCHEKTQGNPFFLRRFIETIHEEGLLSFDRERGQWTWDATRISSRPVGTDVVDFVAGEMRRLPEEARQCLGVAACIGGQLDLATLAFLLDIDRRGALERLRPVLSAHYLLPASEDLFGLDEPGPQRVLFRFAHDRIHQAARSLIDEAEAASAHRRVAELLLEHLDAHEREARLFEVVEHLNQGAAMESASDADAERLRRLNLSAARRASRSAAFEPADDFYKRAYALFQPSMWEDDYEQALAIHIEGARSAYLNGDEESMGRLVDEAVAHARTTLDAVEAREVRIQALISMQRFAEAVSLALELLAALDAPIAADPTPDDVQRVVGATIALLQAHPREEIVQLPLATDPTVMTAQRIRQSVMSAAYLSVPNLLPVLACDLIEATQKDGIARQSAYGFAVFGMVLNAVGLIDLSYETGRIALALLERSEDRSMLAKTRHIVFSHINPFIEPVGESVEHERSVFQVGMDTGDLEYAAWALHIQVAHGFYGGMFLPRLRELDRRNRAVLERYAQLPALGCALPYSQTIENCIGDAVEDSIRLVGPGYDEDRHMEELLKVGFRGAAYILTVMRTFVRFLFRDTAGAARAAEAGGEFADGAIATYHQVWWHQFRALAVLADASADDADAMARARESLGRLEAWLAFSEVNHRHRVELVRAEIARVEGRDGEALLHYDAAIAHAREHGFAHEEGIANELAARFYAARGSETPARAYLFEACEAYSAWGAHAKVQHLQSELGEVLRRSGARRRRD